VVLSALTSLTLFGVPNAQFPMPFDEAYHAGNDNQLQRTRQLRNTVKFKFNLDTMAFE
jgi:hypothetical protein